MNTIDYILIIYQTSVYPKSTDHFDNAYALMGFMDEYEEFALVRDSHNGGTFNNLYLEAGDVFWYGGLLCLINGISLENIFNEIKRMADSNVDTSDLDIPKGIFGAFKKYYRDNKPINISELEGFILYWLYSIVELLQLIDPQYDVPTIIDRVVTLNAEKLTKRLKNNTIHGDGDYR